MSRSTNPNHLRLHQADRGIGVGSAGFTFSCSGSGLDVTGFPMPRFGPGIARTLPVCASEEHCDDADACGRSRPCRTG